MDVDDIDNMDFPLPSHEVNKFKDEYSTSDSEPFKAWICIYPIYFDKNRAFGKGRRVTSAEAIEEPTSVYLLEACMKLGLKATFEPTKRHPQEFENFGRVRVQLRLADGSLANQAIPTKKQLLRKLAPLLPQIKALRYPVDTDQISQLNAGKLLINPDAELVPNEKYKSTFMDNEEIKPQIEEAPPSKRSLKKKNAKKMVIKR